MPSSSAMRKAVGPGQRGRAGETGSPSVPGVRQAELPFPAEHDLRCVGEHVEAVYGALRQGVEAFGGVVAFAAAAELSVSKMSERLRRADNDRGERQRAHLDLLGVLAADPAARQAFLTELSRSWGFEDPVLRVQIDDSRRAEILATALSESTLRKLEREHGLPPGVLG